MKILKSNTKEIFDTFKIDSIERYNGNSSDYQPLHHFHNMTDHEFLCQYFPLSHKVFEDFSKSFYYVFTSSKIHIIEFIPGTSAMKREVQIRDELAQIKYSRIINAYLLKSGYEQIEYGFGNEDLEFADKIQIYYE